MATLTVGQTKAAILLGRGLELNEVAEELGISRTEVCRVLSAGRRAARALTNTQLAVMVALKRQENKQAKGSQGPASVN